MSILSKANHEKTGLGLLLVSFPLYFLLTFGVVAPFGKHSSNKWGPCINAKLAWFLFECPNLIWSVYAYLTRDENVFSSSPANCILLSLFCIHYINRAVLYPIRMSKASQPVNLAVLTSAISFCTVNGYLQGLEYCQFRVYSKNYISSPQFITGFILWCTGFLLNLQADSILRRLRITPPKAQYKIPNGGLFRYTSCANFCGEIIEWLGYAIASNSLSGWSFFAWVCANLIPRGVSHHKWYLEKFEDYPKDRWAVIPFIV